MRLKYHYGAFLLGVLIFLVGGGITALWSLIQGFYLATTIVFLLLYTVCYLLGKKFSTIFFTLATLRFIRNHNGVISMEQYDSFIHSTIAAKHVDSTGELKKRILAELRHSDMVSVQENTITTTNV